MGTPLLNRYEPSVLSGDWANFTGATYSGSSVATPLPYPPNIQPIPALQFYATPPSQPRPVHTPSKRMRDENSDPLLMGAPPLITGQKKRKYTRDIRTIDDRLRSVFASITEVKWNLSEFLHYAFRHLEDDKITKTHRSKSHAAHIHPFLKGNSTYSPSSIIHAWLTCPSSRRTGSNSISDYLSTPYTEIKPVRMALYAFAAQTVESILIKEAESAVKPANGLHASSTISQSPSQTMHWADIGATTLDHVSSILQEHQPLTWHYAMKIAQRKPRVQNGVAVVRQQRPPAGVVTNALSSLLFCRSNKARLLPLARGMLFFASSASADLFSIGSRIGDMPSYSTVYDTIHGLSAQEEMITKAIGSDPNQAGKLNLDNVQNYLLARDQRLGRDNILNTGIAATFIEAHDFQACAYDIDLKQQLLAKNERKKLTVGFFLQIIDQVHLDTVSTLQWLRTLINFVPELEKYKNEVSLRYRTRGAKMPIPVHTSKVHPLASSGKNETITVELKDALLDFFEQLGQTKDKYIRRLFLLGGDGLTYEMFIRLKRYLQFHSDEFQSFALLEPVLELWHTLWTDLSRLFECHWPAGSPTSQDPSTLGHSARLISRKTPPNLKKVDYYPGAQLAYDVLDARMLDCWRIAYGTTRDLFEHFRHLDSIKKIPTFEELEKMAQTLHRTYSSSRAHARALYDTTGSSKWSAPPGSVWNGLHNEASSSEEILLAGVQTDEAVDITGKATKKKDKPPEPFYGDRVLARSIAFMRDTLISREAAYAVAEGDVGRVYEAMKVMLITFAGSTHSKYVTYLLETITNLELECGDTLRATILKSLLVNLSGMPGGFSAGDFVQEYFNRLLEAIVQRKGVDYGDHYVRNVLSRNLHHFARLKTEFREGVGLAKRSGKHANPSTRPEIVTLLKKYQDFELHLRRRGRSIEKSDGDHFSMGIEKLESGKLKKWISDTMRLRGQQDHQQSSGDPGLEEDLGEVEHDEPSGPESQPTHGSMHMVDGELIIDIVDINDNMAEVMAQLDRTPEEDESELT